MLAFDTHNAMQYKMAGCNLGQSHITHTHIDRL